MIGLASSVKAKICSAVDSVGNVPILLNLTGLNFIFVHSIYVGHLTDVLLVIGSRGDTHVGSAPCIWAGKH